MWNSDASLPGDPAICGTAELTAAAASRGVPILVLEAVPGAVGLIYGKPLLIAATRESISLQLCPGLSAVCGAIDVVTEGPKKAQVEEGPRFVGVGYRITAEDVIFQYAGERPVHPAIGGITPAALPEIGRNTVKLSPTNCHPATVGWVNRDRTFIGGVADDIVPILIDVHLVTDEDAVRGDHSRRSSQPVNIRCRRVIVFFQWLFGVRVPSRRLP